MSSSDTHKYYEPPVIDAELIAIAALIQIITELEYSTRARVLNYIAARYAA